MYESSNQVTCHSSVGIRPLLMLLCGIYTRISFQLRLLFISHSKNMTLRLPTEIESCVLRPWREDDKTELVGIANDREVWHNLTDQFPHPYTATDAAFWLKHALEPSASLHLAIESQGRRLEVPASLRVRASIVKRVSLDTGLADHSGGKVSPLR